MTANQSAVFTGEPEELGRLHRQPAPGGGGGYGQGGRQEDPRHPLQQVNLRHIVNFFKSIGLDLMFSIHPQENSQDSDPDNPVQVSAGSPDQGQALIGQCRVILTSDWLQVRIDAWPVSSQYPQGHFVSVVGKTGDLETEIGTILTENDIAVSPFSQVSNFLSLFLSI